MAITRESERVEDDKPMPRTELSALIGRNVVRSLGSPADMLKVQVNPVGGDRYRINVFVGKSVGTARIANSFFLSADREGNIVSSSPKIVRVY